MGKLGLLLVAAFLFMGGYVLFQSDRSDKAIDESQSVRQAELLAREAAQSGFNEMLALARGTEGSTSWDDIDEFLENVGYSYDSPLTRTLGLGSYRAWVEQGSADAYDVVAEGVYSFWNSTLDEADSAYHQVKLRSIIPTDDDPYDPGDPCTGLLCVEGDTEEYELTAGFIESQAGWCSAIYLQQFVPDGNYESGYREEIDIMFESGHYRDGYSTTFEQVIEDGTQLNFILAVDMNCSSEHDWDVAYGDATYNHYHVALEVDAEDINDMYEGTFAMIEEYSSSEGKWRIAFEDQNFYSEDQYLDIKQNGYGDEEWEYVCTRYRRGKCRRGYYTWGGDGWEENWPDYLRELDDYGSQPDYSDQVFWIELNPVEEEEEEEA